MRKNRENRRKEREERARELLKDMGYVLEQTSDEVAAGNTSPFPCRGYYRRHEDTV